MNSPNLNQKTPGYGWHGAFGIRKITTMDTQFHNTTISRSNDILAFDFAGISTLMWKDGELWIRLDDVMDFMTDKQLDFVLSRGVGLMALAHESVGGTYTLYDNFIEAAPPNAKPALREVKRRMLEMIKQEGGAK